MSLADVLRQLDAIPGGSLVPVDWVRAQLRDAGVDAEPLPPDPAPSTSPSSIWTAPDEMRYGVKELATAIGRSVDWIYHRTNERSPLPRLPHKRQDAALVFVAREVRAYLLEHEQTVVQPTSPILPIARRVKR